MDVVKNVCSHSGKETLILTVSQERIRERTENLQTVTISEKLKVTSVIFGWDWSKKSAAMGL